MATSFHEDVAVEAKARRTAPQDVPMMGGVSPVAKAWAESMGALGPDRIESDPNVQRSNGRFVVPQSGANEQPEQVPLKLSAGGLCKATHAHFAGELVRQAGDRGQAARVASKEANKASDKAAEQRTPANHKAAMQAHQNAAVAHEVASHKFHELSETKGLSMDSSMAADEESVAHRNEADRHLDQAKWHRDSMSGSTPGMSVRKDGWGNKPVGWPAPQSSDGRAVVPGDMSNQQEEQVPIRLSATISALQKKLLGGNRAPEDDTMEKRDWPTDMSKHVRDITKAR